MTARPLAPVVPSSAVPPGWQRARAAARRRPADPDRRCGRGDRAPRPLPVRTQRLVRTDGNELVCASVGMLFLWNRGPLMQIARRRVRTTAVVSTAVLSPLMFVMAACTGAGPQTSGAG